MVVSSKHRAMICPSLPHRSSRLKSRILSKGQLIVLTTPSTSGTLSPATFNHTSLKELGYLQETRFLSSTELGMSSPGQPSIQLMPETSPELTTCKSPTSRKLCSKMNLCPTTLQSGPSECDSTGYLDQVRQHLAATTKPPVVTLSPLRQRSYSSRKSASQMRATTSLLTLNPPQCLAIVTE